MTHATGAGRAAPRPHHPHDVVMRGIAAFKFVKAALFVLLALGAFELLRPALMAQVQDWVATLAATYDNALTRRIVAVLQRITGLSVKHLRLVGIVALVYAVLFVTEGVGLWRRQKWAEFLTVIATASLVPFEAYEVSQRLTLPRVGALAINLVIVAYLIVQIRRHHYR